jgi:hypothetical protein
MLRPFFLVGFVWLVAGCDCGAGGSAGGAGDGACVDQDHDGFGTNCPDGEDCDDTSAIQTGIEVCDDLDNDCDGEADEPDETGCNPCLPETCGGGDADSDADEPAGSWGIGSDEPFDPTSDNSNGVTTTPEGALILDGESVSLNLIWVPNTNDATISKVDTRTREVLARYRTGPDGITHNPSRTAVDSEGDVVVGNRAFSQQASLTKIQANDCPDTNGDGEVTTSSEHADLLDWGDDDCVLWRTEIGCVGDFFSNCGIARAVAAVDHVGLDGVVEHRVWGGLFNERKFVELDRDDGELTGEEAQFDRLTPYGAAVDRDLNVWAASFSGGVIGRFDSQNPDDTLEINASSYGITVDEEGYVWVGAILQEYDPDAGSFVNLRGGAVGCYGVAADGLGHTWAADENVGEFHRVTRENPDEVLTIDVRPTFGGFGARGLAIDFDGYVWVFALSSTHAAIIDPATCDDVTCDIEPVLDDCGGAGCLNGPYNYSDMTGLQLRNATNPLGTYEVVVDGCDGVDWGELTWDATVPAGTSVRFRVRTASDLVALAAASWVTVSVDPPDAPPVNVGDALDAAGVAQESLLAIEVALITEVGDSPIVRSFGIESSCDGGID